MAEVNREVIERIRRMEAALDAVQQAVRRPGADDDPEVRQLLRLLAEYLDSGQWLRDYELDESGALPPDLKRGVLAQDTLYDLLTEFGSEETE